MGTSYLSNKLFSLTIAILPYWTKVAFPIRFGLGAPLLKAVFKLNSLGLLVGVIPSSREEFWLTPFLLLFH